MRIYILLIVLHINGNNDLDYKLVKFLLVSWHILNYLTKPLPLLKWNSSFLIVYLFIYFFSNSYHTSQPSSNPLRGRRVGYGTRFHGKIDPIISFSSLLWKCGIREDKMRVKQFRWFGHMQNICPKKVIGW